MNHKTDDSKAKASVFLFFPTAYFVLLDTQTETKPKKPFLPTYRK
jgi:hypothetical protein